jgi:hypothetical protein
MIKAFKTLLSDYKTKSIQSPRAYFRTNCGPITLQESANHTKDNHESSPRSTIRIQMKILKQISAIRAEAVNWSSTQILLDENWRFQSPFSSITFPETTPTRSKVNISNLPISKHRVIKNSATSSIRPPTSQKYFNYHIFSVFPIAVDTNVF